LIFLNFFKDRKTDKLHGNINVFSIGAQEQKLCPNKLKIKERGQQNKFAKI